jgi:hypothetical protein
MPGDGSQAQVRFSGPAGVRRLPAIGGEQIRPANRGQSGRRPVPNY